MDKNKKENIEEIEKIKKDLEECQKKSKEYLEGWQRERANMLNYKKEEIERFSNVIESANEELILKILPVLDNLEKAEKNVPENLKETDYIKGIVQIKKQFENILKDLGVEKIECLGKRFDPHFHEVVDKVDSEEESKGVIVEEVTTGYMMHNKLLRPARVKVSR